MSLIHGYLIDWFNWYDWSNHFHSCIGYGPRHKNIHIILYCILYVIKEENTTSYGDKLSIAPLCPPRWNIVAPDCFLLPIYMFIAMQVQPLHILDSCCILSVCYGVFIFIMARPRPKHSWVVANCSLHMTWSAGIDTEFPKNCKISAFLCITIYTSPECHHLVVVGGTCGAQWPYGLCWRELVGPSKPDRP